MSNQRRVVHRVYTTDPEYAGAARKLDAIQFTDGTFLEIRVHEIGRGESYGDREIDSYSSLIRQCIDQGVKRVCDLRREA